MDKKKVRVTEKQTLMKKKALQLDNNDKRSGIDRRVFSYDYYSPERRSGKDRRSEINK